MIYVGVRGHRGSGKKSFAALLANTLDILFSKSENKREDFDEKYGGWVDQIMKTPDKIPSDLLSTKYTYIDAFGDVPKEFVRMLIGTSQDEMDNQYLKDNMFVNLRTFGRKPKELMTDEELGNIYDIAQVYNKFWKRDEIEVIKDDIWLSLRNFIIYFGQTIMQTYFGANVWLKSIKANEDEDFYNDVKCRIYSDVKTPSELTYIENKNGIIIKLNRPGNHKKNTDLYDLELANDNRYDYSVDVNGDLMSVKEDIWRIGNELTEMVSKRSCVNL
jgi:hypothetical protein